MVRSEDEIKRYDIFKGSIFALLLIATGVSYAQAVKENQSKQLEMGLSMVEPNSEDHVVMTEKVVFKGWAPGKFVYLITEQRQLGVSKVVNLDWSITVDARDLIGEEFYLVAKDDKGNKLDERGPMRFQFDDDLLKRLNQNQEHLQKLPVKVTAPHAGELLAAGPTGFFGTGVPATKLKVYMNKELIAKPDVDENGEWKVSRTLAPGKYRLSAVTNTHTSTIDFEVVKTAGGFTEN